MAAPYQAVRASDGRFVIGANTDRLYRRLCETMGREDLIEHPVYRTNVLRLANRDALIADLEPTLVERTRGEWVDLLLGVGIPAGAILDYAEALENPHSEARNMVMPIQHPVEGEVNNIGFPVKLRGTPQQVRRHPPLLDEHRAEILRELGLEEPEAEASDV